ncbi:MAG: hypothetical protein ACYSSI_12255, partial [Planctomycetota bacterium]
MKELIKTISVILFLSSIFVFEADAGAAIKPTPLAISRVRLDRKSFDPSQKETIDLEFVINKKCDVRVFIYDRLGINIKVFEIPDASSGKQVITWDGKDTKGRLACGNVFLYAIEVTDSKTKEKTIYNPSERTGGLSVKSLEYTFDSETGKIEYVLPKACMIRIRAGLKSGMLARTIIDWRPSSAGRHVETWEGKDTSGTMNLLKHPELDLNLTCYTLPDNTIIAEGKTIPLKAYHGSEHQKNKTHINPWSKKGKYIHYQHNPLVCHEPKYTVVFPKAKKSDVKIPVVSGRTPIRVELDQEDTQHLIN